jgi:hypothetical protein
LGTTSIPQGVGRDSSDLAFGDPGDAVEPWRVTVHVVAPATLRSHLRHVTGAHDDEVTLPDREVMMCEVAVENIGGHAESRFERVNAKEQRQVDEQATAYHRRHRHAASGRSG